MDFSDWFEGIKSVFKSKGWFGTICSYTLYMLIPVIGVMVYSGAIYERVNYVLKGKKNELPKINENFSLFLNRGLKMLLLSLILMPVILLLEISMIGVILIVPISLLLPAVYAHFLATDETIGRFFEFKEIWQRVKNGSESYLKYTLISFLYGFGTSFLIVPLIVAVEVPMLLLFNNMVENSSDMSLWIFPLLFVLWIVMFFGITLIGSVQSFGMTYYLAEYIKKAYDKIPTESSIVGDDQLSDPA